VTSGSACQAGELCGRLAAAVRALLSELPLTDTEDSGKLPDLSRGEALLPTAVAAFGGAYGRGIQPAHQFAKFRL